MSSPGTTVWRHVPRSQVWPGSRGGQEGHAHLHVPAGFAVGRLKRRGGALCGADPWYPVEAAENDLACKRCVDLATRYGVAWPVGYDPVRAVALREQYRVDQLEKARLAREKRLRELEEEKNRPVVVPAWQRRVNGCVCPWCVRLRALCPTCQSRGDSE